MRAKTFRGITSHGRQNDTPEAAILVAVDIAKDHNEVLIELRERRDRRRRFRVANTPEE